MTYSLSQLSLYHKALCHMLWLCQYGWCSQVPLSDAPTMGWLRLVGSIKLHVFFAEYSRFYRAPLQKRSVILSILLTVPTPYVNYTYHVIMSDAPTYICVLHIYMSRYQGAPTFSSCQIHPPVMMSEAVLYHYAQSSAYVTIRHLPAYHRV